MHAIQIEPGVLTLIKWQIHRLAIALAVILLGVTSANAHGAPVGGTHAGLPIPSVSHGEMAVLSGYSSRIVALAQAAPDTNEAFRRVLNFLQIEYSVCMWGLMPGSVTDEASPFNECSHAYLAAVKMVLFDMRTMLAEATRANDLISRIDEEMVLKGMALIACQFSNETFNTADHIFPNWSVVPFHGPSALASLAFLIVASSGTWGGVRALKGAAKSS